MTRKKSSAKRDTDERSLTPEQRILMDLKPQPRSRSISPNAKGCLRERNSPQKPKRKPKPKAKPALTPSEVAAQVAARIAQLSSPAPAPKPSVKVKTLAELQSSKIARLTTKIAVTEGEIERLKREQLKAQEAVQRSLDVQKAAALEVLERRVRVERALRSGKGGDGKGEDRLEAKFLGAREELERGFGNAKEALVSGRPEDMAQILQDEASSGLNLGMGGGKGDEGIMEKVKRLFEKMEAEAKEGVISDGAKMVLDALGKQQQRAVAEGGDLNGNEAIFEALVQALSLDETGTKS